MCSSVTSQIKHLILFCVVKQSDSIVLAGLELVVKTRIASDLKPLLMLYSAVLRG